MALPLLVFINPMDHEILIVDDEPDIVELLKYNLQKEGFNVHTALNGIDAINILKNQKIDLIVLDLMLPGMSGMEVCRIIRESEDTATLPVIMLTAKVEEEDRIKGLETGADDYVTKPFSPRELIARIRAVLRRSNKDTKRIIRLGALEIDREACSVKKNGRDIELSSTEFKLLLHLIENRGRILSRDALLDAIWMNEPDVGPRTVDVHISRIRARIEDDPSMPVYIRTKRGLGYYIGDEF